MKKQENRYNYKKILSAMIAVVMMFSILPLNIFAEDKPADTKEITATTDGEQKSEKSAESEGSTELSVDSGKTEGTATKDAATGNAPDFEPSIDNAVTDSDEPATVDEYFFEISEIYPLDDSVAKQSVVVGDTSFSLNLPADIDGLFIDIKQIIYIYPFDGKIPVIWTGPTINTDTKAEFKYTAAYDDTNSTFGSTGLFIPPDLTFPTITVVVADVEDIVSFKEPTRSQMYPLAKIKEYEFPKTVVAYDVNGNVWSPEVTWEEQNSKDYKTDGVGTYTYKAVFTDNSLYAVAAGVKMPTVSIVIKREEVKNWLAGSAYNTPKPPVFDVYVNIDEHGDIITTPAADEGGNPVLIDFPSSIKYNHGTKTITEPADTDFKWRLYSSNVGITPPSGSAAIASVVTDHKNLWKLDGIYTYVLEMPEHYFTNDENLDFPIAKVHVSYAVPPTVHVEAIPNLHSQTANQTRFANVNNDKPLAPDEIKVTSNGVTFEIPVKWKLKDSSPAQYLENYDPATVGKIVYEAEPLNTVTVADGVKMPTITVDIIPVELHGYIDGTGENIYQNTVTEPPHPHAAMPSIPALGLRVWDIDATLKGELEDGKVFSSAVVGETFTYSYRLDVLTFTRGYYDPYTDEHIPIKNRRVEYNCSSGDYEVGTYTFTVVPKLTEPLSVDVDRKIVQYLPENQSGYDTPEDVGNKVLPKKITISGHDINGDGSITPFFVYYDDVNSNGKYDVGEPQTNDLSVSSKYSNKKILSNQPEIDETWTIFNQKEVYYVKVDFGHETAYYEVIWELVQSPPTKTRGIPALDTSIAGTYVYRAKFTGRKIIRFENSNIYYYASQFKETPENEAPTVALEKMPTITLHVIDNSTLDTITPVTGDGSYSDPYIYHLKVGETALLDKKFSEKDDHTGLDSYYQIDNIEYNFAVGGVHGNTAGSDLLSDISNSTKPGASGNPHGWVFVLDEAQAPLKTVDEALLASGNFEKDSTGKLIYKNDSITATKTAKWVDMTNGVAEIELTVEGLAEHIPTNADIVIAFDASASMVDHGVWNNAMTVLKQAGNQMFENGNENNVRVSLVPFASDTHSTFNFRNSLDGYLDGVEKVYAPEKDTRTNYSVALAHIAAYADMRTDEEKAERPLQVIFFTDGDASKYENTAEYSANHHKTDDYSLGKLDDIGSSRLAVVLHYAGDNFDDGDATLRKIHNLDDNFASGYLRMEHSGKIDPAYLQIVSSMFDSASNIYIKDLISEHFTVIQTETNFANGIADGSILYNPNVGGREEVTFFAPKLEPNETLSFKIPVKLNADEMISGGKFPTNHDVTENLGADVSYVNFLWDIKNIEIETPFLDFSTDATPPTPTPPPTETPPPPPTETTTPPSTETPPQTGDNSNVLLWLLLASTSGFVLLIVSIKRNKCKKK